MENNKAIAGILRQIAVLLDEQGVAFKPAAYRKAAVVLDNLEQDVSEIGDEKELKKLPGIGDAIAAKIIEYLQTGEVSFLGKLRAEQGGIAPELLDIENLGPKRARLLQSELGITTAAQLIKAAEEGKLRNLPRLSEDMEKKILESAKRVKERTKRFPRAEIKDDVQKLIDTISEVDGVERCTVAGSFRREKPTVGDIDILVITKSAVKVADAISKLSIVRDVVAHGDTKISFDLHSGLRVDVRLVKKDQWGSALLYFTGSKDHNIAMRKIAIKNGWKLSEYGLFEGEKVLASKEEEDIYEKLDLRYYQPNEREHGL